MIRESCCVMHDLINIIYMYLTMTESASPYENYENFKKIW